MSSMTDLVFLLLIFFVIVSTLVSPYALPVSLPSGKATTEKKDHTIVTIAEGGDMRVDGRAVDSSTLEAALLESMKDRPEGTIALRAASSVPTGITVEVLDLAKRHHWKIALASTTP